MTRKSLFTASLLLPLIAMSGVAYAGPTWTPARSPSQTSGSEAYIAYAQYVPTMQHVGGWECSYQGGPKSPLVHSRRQ